MGLYAQTMSDAGLDLELVISENSALTIPPADLARLRAVPGKRVRVRIDKTPASRQSRLGALEKPDQTTLTIDDFDALSDETWASTGYGSDSNR